jgi:hypothetical protein
MIGFGIVEILNMNGHLKTKKGRYFHTFPLILVQ